MLLKEKRRKRERRGRMMGIYRGHVPEPYCLLDAIGDGRGPQIHVGATGT